MATLRSEVLRCFKKLHKTRLFIFNGDDAALKLSRDQINVEFRKCKDVTDKAEIEKLLNQGLAVEHELRTTVIQAEEVRPGVYEARINPDTVKLDNFPFNEDAVIEVDANAKKCQDK